METENDDVKTENPIKRRLTEDWLAVVIGFIIIILAATAEITGFFDFATAKFGTWGNGVPVLDRLDSTLLINLVRTFLVIGCLFVAGMFLKGDDVKRFVPAFAVMFLLAVLVRFISAEYTMSRYLEWAFFAIIVGLLISNTVGVPERLKPAIQTEFYIKAGLVVMGFSVLFTNIVKFGLYGIGIAWLVTPVVIMFMWFLGTRVLKMRNDPLVITMAAATSVCGTSAAIATSAASNAKKSDLSLVVSISIIFTVILMVLEPIVIEAVGMSEIMGGALIGGTVDSTGAVAVAGTVLGETGQKSAILIKSIQNVLIGFIAFAVAVFFASRMKRKGGSAEKVSAKEIWTRLPKFILGFFAASMVASFIVVPLWGTGTVSAINGVLDQYKNWLFVLAFLSIGLDTNFREIRKQMSGGKPLILYVTGQAFNIVLTFAMVFILLSGTFFPIPELT